MKLNKPPVSEEQSLLEDYVDFLLTDLSNVTPIDSRLKKKPREVDSLSGAPEISIAHDNDTQSNSASFADSRAEESIKEESKAKQREFKEQAQLDRVNESVGREKINSLSKSKNVEVKVEVEKTGDDSLNQKETVSGKTQSSSAIENHTNDALTAKVDIVGGSNENNTELKREKRPQPLENVESKHSNQESQTPHISHAEDDYSVEAEEEEAKLWDAVITKEKENLLLDPDKSKQLFNEQQNTKASFDRKDENIHQNENTALVSKYSKEADAEIPNILPHKPEDERLAKVEKLLARISLATKPKVNVSQEAKSISHTSDVVETEHKITPEAAEATFIHRDAEKLKDILPDVFQTLIFKVDKMPLAVPLLKLGGIVKISEEDITPLVGTPDWFLGLTPNDRGNLMVIDTQQYLMPEQARIAQEKISYEYLIILDNSNWALACHSVGDAKNLTSDDIRWSERSSRRPWFAGMVVDYMSALIEVDELINMLADRIAK